MDARHKAQQIENAELRRHATVNDSQMVDEMFGFIEAQVDMASEAGAPTAFQVENNYHELSPSRLEAVFCLSAVVFEL